MVAGPSTSPRIRRVKRSSAPSSTPTDTTSTTSAGGRSWLPSHPGSSRQVPNCFPVRILCHCSMIAHERTALWARFVEQERKQHPLCSLRSRIHALVLIGDRMCSGSIAGTTGCLSGGGSSSSQPATRSTSSRSSPTTVRYVPPLLRPSLFAPFGPSSNLDAHPRAQITASRTMSGPLRAHSPTPRHGSMVSRTLPGSNSAHTSRARSRRACTRP